MSKHKKLDSVPELPLLAANLALAASHTRGSELTYQLMDVYNPKIEEFRAELQGHFMENYSTEIDRKLNMPVWEPTKARYKKTVVKLTESFKDAVKTSQREAVSIMDTELTENLDEAYNYTLWGAYQSGIDVGNAPKLGNLKERKTLLIAAGVGSLSYIDRLKMASSLAEVRFSTWLRSSVIAGSTLQYTLQGLDHISSALKSRVTLLAENENHRSFILGTHRAADIFKSELQGTVWLARASSCLTCIEKHLTITSDRPAESSHPGCRCSKVLVPVDYTGRPIPYDQFIQSMG